MAQLCEALGVPQLRLERHFSAELGRTPGAEILRQRLARAKALLLETEMPLAEVAARCGFCNASYLSNLFRRETGLAPRAWRKAAERG
ncbi:MAG: helix-turn-helix transcriptional regulator [Kiritimatiellae bacterium]|nr:helix-turn-helix transcriptional regulator [Kiritimatiellia bacterium]